jgi:hypothetical protein
MVNLFFDKQKIIIAAVILLGIIILVSALTLQESDNKSGTDTKSSETQKPLPASNKSTLKIASISTDGHLVDWTEPVEISFNEPVSFENAYIEITPESQFSVNSDFSGYKIIIDPADAWMFDTEYKITIKSKTHTSFNNYLDKDYVYNFKTKPYTGI